MPLLQRSESKTVGHGIGCTVEVVLNSSVYLPGDVVHCCVTFFPDSRATQPQSLADTVEPEHWPHLSKVTAQLYAYAELHRDWRLAQGPSSAPELLQAPPLAAPHVSRTCVLATEALPLTTDISLSRKSSCEPPSLSLPPLPSSPLFSSSPLSSSLLF